MTEHNLPNSRSIKREGSTGANIPTSHKTSSAVLRSSGGFFKFIIVVTCFILVLSVLYNTDFSYKPSDILNNASEFNLTAPEFPGLFSMTLSEYKESISADTNTEAFFVGFWQCVSYPFNLLSFAIGTLRYLFTGE